MSVGNVLHLHHIPNHPSSCHPFPLSERLSPFDSRPGTLPCFLVAFYLFFWFSLFVFTLFPSSWLSIPLWAICQFVSAIVSLGDLWDALSPLFTNSSRFIIYDHSNTHPSSWESIWSIRLNNSWCRHVSIYCYYLHTFSINMIITYSENTTITMWFVAFPSVFSSVRRFQVGRFTSGGSLRRVLSDFPWPIALTFPSARSRRLDVCLFVCLFVSSKLNGSSGYKARSTSSPSPMPPSASLASNHPTHTRLDTQAEYTYTDTLLSSESRRLTNCVWPKKALEKLDRRTFVFTGLPSSEQLFLPLLSHHAFFCSLLCGPRGLVRLFACYWLWD